MIDDAGFRLSVMATAGLLAWANPLGRVARGHRRRTDAALARGEPRASRSPPRPRRCPTSSRPSGGCPWWRRSSTSRSSRWCRWRCWAACSRCWRAARRCSARPSAVATIAGLPGWVVLHVVVAIVRIAAAVPFAAVSLPPGVAEATAVAAGAVVLAGPAVLCAGSDGGGSPRGRRRPRPPGGVTWQDQPARRSRTRVAGRAGRRRARRRAIAGAAFGEAIQRETRITVLDVGQGDAILLETRTGARMLVDGGPDPGPSAARARRARSRPGTAGSTSSCSRIRTRTTSRGWPGSSSATRSGASTSPACAGRGPAGRPGTPCSATGRRAASLATGAQLRLGEVRLAVLWPDPGSVPARAVGHRDRDQQRVRRVPRARRTAGGSC